MDAAVHHIYAVRVKDRDRVRDALVKVGIGASVHYPKNVHQYPPYKGRVEQGSLPETEAWARGTLSLPMFPGIREDEVERVAEALRRATMGQ